MEEATRQTETKHTPGPWYAYSLLASGIHAGYQYGIANSEPQGVCRDEDGCVVPEFPNWNRDSRIIAKTTDSETARNDARLIAASPDLLAACEAALRTCENNKYVRSGFDELIPTLRAAICKAKGGAA